MDAKPVKLSMIGQTLGHYRIESKIGEGGMGVVYKARDTHLDRDVAVKVLPSEAVANPERKRRFVQEAKAASSLNHPNIIHIYDIDTAGGVDFIAMEFVPGRTLDQLIGRKGLSLSEALKYAIQIADALARAHGAGIIHRDLKPGNIMVTPEGLVKVLDFGLAKLAERDADDQKTLTVDAQPRTEEGTIVGTVAYMSPEQAQGGKLDARSDIFSFGAMLYEMVTGQRAFQRQSRISTLAAILHEEPKAVTESLEAAPRDLEKIIARCLRKDPDRRLQHMADIKTLLEDLKEESESGQLPTPAAKRDRRLSPVLVGLVLVLLAATALVTWRLTRSPKPAPSTATYGLARLTSDTGLTTDPALSPDGKLVAYASDRSSEGNLDIWVQQAGTSEALRLTSNPADEREPAFSPDGSRIAYRSEQEGGGVYMVSSLGGESRRIAKEGRSPRYSPSGESIAYWVGGISFQALVQGKVYVAPASGGEPRQIQPEFHSAAFPLWSPDGKSLLFLGVRDPGEPSAVAGEMDWWITPLEGNRSSAVKTGVLPVLRQRKFQFGNFGGNWVTAAGWLPGPNGTSRILFSAQSGDVRNIWQIAVSDKTRQAEGDPERLTFGAGLERLTSAAALVGGSVRLAFANLTENLGIWALPLDANRGVVKGSLQVLTPGPDAEWRPSISLDGKRMIYVRQHAGSASAWFKDLPSGKERLVASGANNARITPDGSKIAYISRGTVYALSLSGGDPEPICEDCFVPTGWSADGTKLLDEAVAGHPLGLVVPGQRKRIPIIRHASYALSGARFSPDDRWIAFHAIPGPTSRRIFVAPFRDPSLPGASPIEEKDWIPITDGAGMERYPAWSPDGNLLYFLSERDGFRCLRAQRLDPATKRPIGAPMDVYHFHSARLSLLGAGDPINVNPAVAADKVVFGLLETTGNIWMTELAAPAR